MADDFFALSDAHRRDGLEVAAARSGRAVHLIEKDVWVVWTLNAQFDRISPTTWFSRAGHQSAGQYCS
jgi:hypothetical protein